MKLELSGKLKGLSEMWLLDHLTNNNWWIRREQAQKIAHKLRLPREHLAYYQDIYIWIPDKRWGIKLCCPTCKKSGSHVQAHGFRDNHYARLVVGMKETYYVLSRRYICKACEQTKSDLDHQAEQVVEGVDQAERINFKYTFMGWDRDLLPLLKHGLGDEFPAFFTHRAGLDKQVIDLMRPLFDNQVRPETLSDIMLEMHTKEHTRWHLRYERDLAKNKFDTGRRREMFSLFADEEKYRGKVPTGSYLLTASKQFHETIQCHLSKEVKKRGATILSWDVSYKVPKHLYQHHGKPIFQGLVTATNEFGEVRIQFHVVTDEHKQMVTAIEAFKNTTREYGQPPLKLFFTDDPSRDKNFFTNIFPSLKEHNNMLNSNGNCDREQGRDLLPECPYYAENVRMCTKTNDINLVIDAMREEMQRDKGISVDCEWKVQQNSRGMPTGRQSKISLIQIGYYNSQDTIKTILIQTSSFKKLPARLVALLQSDTVQIVGVNVGGDLKKIGRDFKIEKEISDMNKDRIINLGVHARKRDVVQSGSVSLLSLCNIVLNQTIQKNDHLRFSEWDAKTLSAEQIKYAALDAIVSLRIFAELEKKPDLTRRLQKEEAVPGLKVDLVPRHGSVACMATRAATACIVQSYACPSPAGIKPPIVEPGKGNVLIELETIYSPALKVPRYYKEGSNQHKTPATLADFDGICVVVPISMLKQHTPTTEIRATPTDNNLPNVDNNERAGRSIPADANTAPDSNCQQQQKVIEISGGVNNRDCPTMEHINRSMGELTSDDIELLRLAVITGEEASQGKVPLQCDGLDPPPKPEQIMNVYSTVLGDVFHAINRPKIGVRSEYKKGYHVALRDAFFIWDNHQLNELEKRMKASGVSQKEIDSVRYYNPRLFHGCIARHVPSPSILYWRVRAVFVLYGPLIDSKTKRPVFDKKAWKKANNVLKEILLGYYSDPPGIEMYTKKMDQHGSVKQNKFGMDMIECLRGTNRTEAHHKGLASTVGGWTVGVEQADNLLKERRHRNNHRCSERRRYGFPKIGHYETWWIDTLQTLVLQNHGRVLYPHWSNSSEYKETDESFDTVALHASALHAALSERWGNNVKDTGVQISRDLKYLSDAMGTELPFLPFHGENEYKLFQRCVLDSNFPQDDEGFSIEWCKFVNGIDIFPKLEVHIRQHREKWEKNQRVKDAIANAKEGHSKLKQLNAVMVPAKSADEEPPIHIPEPLETINQQAMHNRPYTIVGGMCVGTIPTDEQIPKRGQGKRGRDEKQRKRRLC